MTIGLSHGGTTIYSSPTLSNHILVGTREGAVSIERDAPGAPWRIGQRSLTDKHISAIIKEPESGLSLRRGVSRRRHGQRRRRQKLGSA